MGLSGSGYAQDGLPCPIDHCDDGMCTFSILLFPPHWETNGEFVTEERPASEGSFAPVPISFMCGRSFFHIEGGGF